MYAQDLCLLTFTLQLKPLADTLVFTQIKTQILLKVHIGWHQNKHEAKTQTGVSLH